MDAITAACLDMLSTNAADLRATVNGLSAEALNWTPAPETNSIAVLVNHAVTATHRLVESALTGTMNQGRYRAEERTPAFATTGADAAGLLARIDLLDETIAMLTAGGDAADYAGEIRWIGDDGGPRTRAWSLIHALEHLREHVGHAQLTRQLWQARAR